MAKKETVTEEPTAPAPESTPEAPELSHHHYDGKQLYPKTLYGKSPTTGDVVSIVVADANAHADLAKTHPGYDWASSPAEHGVETAPGVTAAPFAKV